MLCTIVLSLTYIYVVFCQKKYGEEMVRVHGEGINWREQELDSMALYTSGRGKSHGW
jgi:hypothetical protein